MPVPSQQVLNSPKHVAATTLTSVTTGGTTGTTHWGYKIVGLDANGNPTAASAEVVATNGNAILSSTNKETLAWTDPVGASNIAIYRTTAGGTPNTTGLIGTVAAGVQTFVDTGLIADGSTPPASDLTGTGLGTAIIYDIPYVWITGTFVATVQVQASPDGSTWANVGSTLTAPGFIEVPTAKQVRVKTTAYTSGTVVATLFERRL